MSIASFLYDAIGINHTGTYYHVLVSHSNYKRLNQS